MCNYKLYFMSFLLTGEYWPLIPCSFNSCQWYSWILRTLSQDMLYILQQMPSTEDLAVSVRWGWHCLFRWASLSYKHHSYILYRYHTFLQLLKYIPLKWVITRFWVFKSLPRKWVHVYASIILSSIICRCIEKFFFKLINEVLWYLYCTSFKEYIFSEK